LPADVSKENWLILTSPPTLLPKESYRCATMAVPPGFIREAAVGPDDDVAAIVQGCDLAVDLD
jgi:hypothetical protein